MAGERTPPPPRFAIPNPALPLRILILEDSALDAELEIALLEGAGYACQWVRVQTRDEFEARLQSTGYDLIFADYNLPSFDGLTALKLVRERGMDIPFIQISGTIGEEAAIEGLKAGATDYVLKSRLARLVPVVRRALQEQEARRRSMQPEEALRKLSRAVEQSPSMTLITDAAGRIEYVNPKFTQVTGYTLAEVVGQNPRLLKSGMNTAEEYQRLWETIGAGNEWRGELHNRRKNGELYWVFASVSPIKDPAGTITHFMAVQEDISERKRAEDEIRILNQELERRVSERTAQLEAANRELETFSHSVSHDLRAPLRAIDGFGKALQEEYAHTLDAQGQHYLERVLTGTQQMGQLIDALLSLSRVSRMELLRSTVDLSALTQTIAANFREREPQRNVTFVIAAGLRAYGDGRLLRVVLENLVGNAWKYTSKHAQARIELGVIEQNGGPVYFVRDDGAGFEIAYAGKLFGAFQRLHSDSEFPGTGIGLATVQRVIHRHGGRIWADGTVEGGATFYFTLLECLAAPPRLPPST